MRFEFIVDEHVKVKTFLKKHEVSKGLLAKIKFRGGQILVNGRPENAVYLLDIGDRLLIDIPAEESFDTLKPLDRPLDILFEDDHFLVLNKPFGIASIPSAIHSNTLANIVKGYYVKQGRRLPAPLCCGQPWVRWPTVPSFPCTTGWVWVRKHT